MSRCPSAHPGEDASAQPLSPERAETKRWPQSVALAASAGDCATAAVDPGPSQRLWHHPAATLARLWASASLGVRYMAGAAVLFSIMALLVKLAGERLPATQIVLARAVVSLILAYGVLRRGGISPWGTHQGLLILRGLLGFGALLCFFYALTQLPLAEATVIQFMNPVFATLLAAWILRERAGRPEGAALILGLAGVLLITRPEWLTGAAHDNRPLLAVGIALAGSVLSSGAYVTVRRLAHLENPHVIVFYFPLVTLPLVLPLVWTVWIWPTPAEWAMLLGIGVATQIAQVWMTRALHAESTGRATSAGYLQILFASFWGFLFFGERPDLWFLAGALCIGAGVGWVAFRKPT